MSTPAISAVIFDLDGVIVSTDECHYQAWRAIAEREGVPFDRHVNDKLRGVGRLESLNIILDGSSRVYSEVEKAELAEEKNQMYRGLLARIGPRDILPGVMTCLRVLKKLGIRTAIGSSSKNARLILDQIGLTTVFDEIVDGNDIVRGKPDPEVFVLAAARLGVPAEECIVVEDAYAGVEAALLAGMVCLGVGSASSDMRAQYRSRDLTEAPLESIFGGRS